MPTSVLEPTMLVLFAGNSPPCRQWLRILLLLPGMSLALALPDSGSASPILRLNWNDNSSNEDGFQIERAANGEGFAEFAQVPANVTSYQDTDLRPGATYVYRVRAFNGTGDSGYSNIAFGTASGGAMQVSPAPESLPLPYHPDLQQGEIGPSSASSAAMYNLSSDSITVYSHGHDLSSTSDRAHFVRQSFQGELDVAVRVDEIAASDPWAKAGIMMRASEHAGSPHVSLLVTHGAGVSLQWRAQPGGESAGSPPTPGSAARWIRLIRAGDSFAGYTSIDRSFWTPVYAMRVTLPDEVKCGLVTTSHDNNRAVTVTYSGLSTLPLHRDHDRAYAVLTSDNHTSPFSGIDVGKPFEPGHSTLASETGDFIVESGGIDVWNEFDQFHFVCAPAIGNAELIVEVASIIGRQDWAKAGLMFRTSASPDSPNVSLFATPKYGVHLQWRASPAARTVSIPVAPYQQGGWLKLTRVGDVFCAYRSIDGKTWSEAASTTVPLPITTLFGLATSAHSPVDRVTALYQNFEVFGLPPAHHLLPTETFSLAQLPVGLPFAEGSAFLDSAYPPFESPGLPSYYIAARGVDIWDRSDEFHFCYAMIEGDSELVVRVAGMTPTDPWSKAGLMFRESLMPDARHVSVFLTPGCGAVMQARPNQGSQSYSTPPGSPLVYQWLRLRRLGNTYHADRSFDGVVWEPVGSTQFPMSDPAFAGLAVTSHNPVSETWAVFEEFSLRKLHPP